MTLKVNLKKTCYFHRHHLHCTTEFNTKITFYGVFSLPNLGIFNLLDYFTALNHVSTSVQSQVKPQSCHCAFMYLILEHSSKHFYSHKCPLCCGAQQDFKVAWFCCCNLSSSQTDSSLQLMNVTHLSRLAQPSGERGRGLGLRNMKKSKKIKKSTWKVLTFVVYYRIHLNLNLEASARQWPLHYRAHSFVGKSTLKPLVRRVALDQIVDTLTPLLEILLVFVAGHFYLTEPQWC